MFIFDEKNEMRWGYWKLNKIKSFDDVSLKFSLAKM